MLAGLTARQFEEWKAFWELEPWGDEWRQTGVQAAASVQPWSKKPVDPETYMPPTRGAKFGKAASVWNKVTTFLTRKKEALGGNRRRN